MTAKTDVQENPVEGDSFLSSEDRAIISQVATMEPPDSQRALALLAIDEGATQAEAGIQAGLTIGQLRYWLGKFRKDGTSIFPEELLNQAQQEDLEEAHQELPVAEESAGPVDEAVAQKEDMPKAKKKSKKKAMKGKKSKKKSKKKGSKKGKGAKGKSSKKAKKKGKK